MASQANVTHYQVEKIIYNSITSKVDIENMTSKIKSLINKYYKHWYVIIDIQQMQAIVDLHIYDCKDCLNFELANLELDDLTEYKKIIIIDGQ